MGSEKVFIKLGFSDPDSLLYKSTYFSEKKEGHFIVFAKQVWNNKGSGYKTP
jgi:hypothetical protein